MDSEGEVCVTWLYPDGSITNCAPVFKTGDNSYKFGDREFSVQAGDVKGLGQ